MRYRDFAASECTATRAIPTGASGILSTGAILVALDDVLEVQRQISEWRQAEGVFGELKWEKMRGGLRLKQFKSLVDLLFSLARNQRLIRFKAIILDRHAPEYRIYSGGNDEIGFYKTYYHWLLRYFVSFPLKHRCQLTVIIDDRDLPKNAKDPFTKLKFAPKNGIRKELDATRRCRQGRGSTRFQIVGPSVNSRSPDGRRGISQPRFPSRSDSQ